MNWHTARRAVCPAGSWRRGSAARDYGVPLEEIEPVFTGTENLGSLFFQCGNEVLGDLHSTLANEPVSMMLTDAEGVVLSRLSGDRNLLEALDDVHLAPRFRLRRTRRRHQRPRYGAGRPRAHAGACRPALRVEPVHLHMRRGSRVRSCVGTARRQRQPHHLVAVLQ